MKIFKVFVYRSSEGGCGWEAEMSSVADLVDPAHAWGCLTFVVEFEFASFS
jgi:hypothetical protein